jgi:hypothetical protein
VRFFSSNFFILASIAVGTLAYPTPSEQRAITTAGVSSGNLAQAQLVKRNKETDEQARKDSDARNKLGAERKAQEDAAARERRRQEEARQDAEKRRQDNINNGRRFQID